MIDLPQPWNWIVMLLVAASLGALGGLAHEFLHKNRSTEERLGWFAGPLVGAAAALAILYFFPPQIPTVTVAEDGTSTTTYVYDLVKLVALSLIAGSAGGTLLSAMQARVLAQVKEQQVKTAEQKVRAVEAEKDVMQAKLEQMPTIIENTINNEVQPVVKEQLEKAANELPPPLADKLPQESGTLSNELEQLIEEAQPADPEEKVAVVQDALDKVLYEVKETAGIEDRQQENDQQPQAKRLLQIQEDVQRLQEELKAERSKGLLGRLFKG
jgi:4-amino-4-deoxy-L-arabinose transferase-like glycosyltransferase